MHSAPKARLSGRIFDSFDKSNPTRPRVVFQSVSHARAYISKKNVFLTKKHMNI